MKSACDYIYEAMASVYNLSIEQGVVPSILKTSEVLPVDKGGDITDPSTVTAALFRYFPCVPRKQLSYVEKYDILYIDNNLFT